MTLLYTNQEIADEFKKIDTDKSGEIDREEFLKGLQKLCPGFDANTAEDLFDKVDVNHNGLLDLQEFTYIMRFMEMETNPDNLFIALWNKFDTDGNGTLDKEEFFNLWRSVLPNLNDEILDTFFKKFDDDGNGTIDFRE